MIISYAEHGKRLCTLKTMKKLATALNVSVSWLACFELLPEETFTQKLKKARLVRGLCRDEAAKIIGCDVKSLCNWELGYKKPTKAFEDKINQFIGVLTTHI